jgi:putative ABC transport system permease protein
VAGLPEAARLQDLAALRAQVDGLMGLGLVMLGMMLAFSVILAAAILFNTATLNILERGSELATLRALGRTGPELALALTLEHALLAVLGFALGLPAAMFATRWVLALYSSDLFALPYVMSPPTVLVAAVGVVLTLLLAQWPALRQLARANLAEAVRTREG